MINKTFEEKAEFIRKVRKDNYRESCRLEGIILKDLPEDITIEKIIEKYSEKGLTFT
jgi:hypothetical protein